MNRVNVVFSLVSLSVSACYSQDRPCRKCEWLNEGPQCVKINEDGVTWMISRGLYRHDRDITWEAEPHCVRCGHKLSADKSEDECRYCGAQVVCDRTKRGDVIVRAKNETPRPLIEIWKHKPKSLH